MQVPNINITSKVFNKAYLKLFRDLKPYKVLKGGAGSGKSVFISQRLVLKAIDILKGKRKILVIRKVGKTLKESVYSEIKKQIYNYKLESFANITQNNIKILDSEFIFSGLDDPEKIKSISGITDIWIEEATELTITDFIQLEIRLRGKIKEPEMYLSFNPISANHWLKRFFFDYSEENKKYREITELPITYTGSEFSVVIWFQD